MKKQPLVSIIMNCYNGEEFLREALESVLSQTYKNWELIFWDNQSSDESSTILKSFNESRFHYYYANEHRNLYDARNLAVRVSKGDLVAFLDTDDTWVSNKLELQVPCFDDPNVALVYGNYWIHNNKKDKYIKRYRRVLPSGNILRYLLKDYVVGLLTIIVRKKAYLTLEKQFDSRFPMSGDFDFVIRLGFNNCFAAIQQPIATYRWHGNNNSKLYFEKQIKELELWYQEMSVNKKYSSIRELLFVKVNINYHKGKKNAEEGNFLLAMKYFLLMPLCLNKFKLLFAMVFPNFFVKLFYLTKN